MAVVVLRKASMFNPKMYLPPELVEIILQSVVVPPKLLRFHADYDDENELGFEYTNDPKSEDEDGEDQYTEDDQDQESDSDHGVDDDDEQDEIYDHYSRLLCVIS
jgi:hypothetical protein